MHECNLKDNSLKFYVFGSNNSTINTDKTPKTIFYNPPTIKTEKLKTLSTDILKVNPFSTNFLPHASLSFENVHRNFF